MDPMPRDEFEMSLLMQFACCRERRQQAGGTKGNSLGKLGVFNFEDVKCHCEPVRAKQSLDYGEKT